MRFLPANNASAVSFKQIFNTARRVRRPATWTHPASNPTGEEQGYTDVATEEFMLW